MGLIDRLQHYGLFPDRANGNGRATPSAVKATTSPPVSFIPRDSEGNTIDMGEIVSSAAARVSVQTAMAASAYCYVALRYRAEKVSEAPLVVRKETKAGEEWLPDHEIAGFLDAPSPDYDMSELRHLTQLYRDITGGAIWLKDMDRAGRTARLTPFSAEEFEVKQANGRIYGEYKVELERGPQKFPPERVIHFREINASDRWQTFGWVHTALASLNLSQEVMATATNLLRRSLLPSVIIQTSDKWNPGDGEWQRFQDLLDNHAQRANKGKALAITGGGTATVVSAKIAELLPSELLNRVESVVAACSGIPAVVLQYLVGLQNSPWSQMEEARRMGYEDTISGIWRRDEALFTRQLLREFDDDPAHFIRHDTSRIAALKADDTKRAAVVAQLADVWTVDEARIYTGQEPYSDPAIGKKIISQARPAPAPPSVLPGSGVPNPDPADDPADDGVEDGEEKSRRRPLDAKSLRLRLFETVRDDEEIAWELQVAAQLEQDRANVIEAIDQVLNVKAVDDVSPEKARRIRRAAQDALSEETWHNTVLPLVTRNAERALSFVAVDLRRANFNLLRDDVIPFVQREAAWLVREINATTRQAISDELARGIEAGEGTAKIARRLADMPAFGRDRAKLVARTEVTRVMNGAPQEALVETQRRTGQKFVKTWWSALDARVRDEHEELHGEQQPVEKPFSNGLMAPGEPNCRCTMLFSVAAEAGGE
jgi:SPP1 gp7 family putative phage head morphogenesis protein